MRRPIPILAATLLALAAFALLAVRSGAHAQETPPPHTANARCTFTNPAFSGKCVESAPIPAKGTPAAACREILSCLNNPMCTRTYCQATTIRSGWQLESAMPAR